MHYFVAKIHPIAAASGPRILTFLHADFDWRDTLHPRQQSLLLFDADGNLLNAAWGGKSDHGVYSPFVVDANRPLKARFMKHRSACVAVGGRPRSSLIDPDNDHVAIPVSESPLMYLFGCTPNSQPRTNV